jgi:PKD repeat protein
MTVTVNNVAPTVTKGAMDQKNSQFILPGVHTLTFHGTFSDPGWLDTHTATWNFGDGLPAVTKSLTEENNQPDATGTVTATHVYSAPGNYQVTVTVTDDDLGATTSAAWTVHVADVVEAKHDLAAYIQSLPSNAFKGKEVQQKATFANMFIALDKMIADKEWNGFITSLQSNIRSKADGQVDGKPQDDWIKDKTAQQHICMKIDDIVAYVKTFK